MITLTLELVNLLCLVFLLGIFIGAFVTDFIEYLIKRFKPKLYAKLEKM